jgi:hypothetical protein
MKRAVKLALAATVLILTSIATSAEPVQIAVYRSPTCGCCTKWAKHLEEHGFSVVVHNVPDVQPVKRENGVPPALASCHTALVGGYVIEGHVPAEDIARLLAQRPRVSGLAVPGMPIGSPGMEGPNPERYDVLSFDRRGRTAVFSSHGP